MIYPYHDNSPFTAAIIVIWLLLCRKVALYVLLKADEKNNVSRILQPF